MAPILAVESIVTMNLTALVSAVAVVALAAALILRIATNYFHGSAPPVDEGVPFVGGLIKFSKVC